MYETRIVCFKSGVIAASFLLYFHCSCLALVDQKATNTTAEPNFGKISHTAGILFDKPKNG